MDLASMRDTYASSSQSFRPLNLRKGVSTESCLDRRDAFNFDIDVHNIQGRFKNILKKLECSSIEDLVERFC